MSRRDTCIILLSGALLICAGYLALIVSLFVQSIALLVVAVLLFGTASGVLLSWLYFNKRKRP